MLLIRYRWIKNGVPFDWENPDLPVGNLAGGTLAFFQTKSTDVGDYQCAATNKYGTSMSEVMHVMLETNTEVLKQMSDLVPQVKVNNTFVTYQNSITNNIIFFVDTQH